MIDSSENESRLSVDWLFLIIPTSGGDAEMRLSGEDSSVKL